MTADGLVPYRGQLGSKAIRVLLLWGDINSKWHSWKDADLRVNIYVSRIDVLFSLHGDKINFMCFICLKNKKSFEYGVFVCLSIYRDIIVNIRKYCLKSMLKSKEITMHLNIVICKFLGLRYIYMFTSFNLLKSPVGWKCYR